MILGTVYTFILLALMGVILYPDVPYTEVLLMSMTVYLLFTFILSYRIATWIFLVLTALSSTAVTYLCWVETPFSKPVLDIVEGIIGIWYAIVNNIPIPFSPAVLLQIRIFMAVSAIVASILIHLFFRKKFNFYILTALLLTMFFFSWFMSGKVSKLLFLVFCLLSVLAYIRHIYKKKSGLGLVAEKLPLGNFMLLSIPFAVIPVLAVALMPKYDQPIQWPWLDQKIMAVMDYFEQRYSTTNMEFFSLSSTGFSGRPQRLGGPIRPNNIVVMDVKTEMRTYLRGAAYSDYTGISWTRTMNEDKEALIYSMENENEVWETKNGWLSIPVDEMFTDVSEDDKLLLDNLSQGVLEELLFPTYPIEVKFRNMTTRTVFTPLKSIMPVKNKDNFALDLLEDSHGNASAQEKLPSGTIYKLDYIQPMYGEPILKKALLYSRKNLYKDALDIRIREREKLLDDVKALKSGHPVTENQVFDSKTLDELNLKISDLTQLYLRAKSIEEEYTRLYEYIPQRVRDMAQNLTVNCNTDYEKAVLIENYLRNNYVYTLNAGNVPEGKDFVDYFLFEDNKGYCTYYATSMTVLLRSLGIPARYVEGYVLPEDSNEDEIFTVTNKNAHAWVEVYFEGFGWLTFEPTSIYADTMNYRNEAAMVSNAIYPYNPDLEELLSRYEPRDDLSDYVPYYPRTEIKKPNLLFAVFIFAGIIASSVLINLFAVFINALEIYMLKPGKKVLKLYGLSLHWFSLAGSTIKPGETVGEFSRRIGQIYYFPDTKFEKVTEVFVKVRYGKREVSREEIKMMLQFLSEEKKVILNELGLRRYIPLRKLIYGI